MKKLRHFSQMTISEIKEMRNRAIKACCDYRTEIHVGGLSHLGVHNVYEVINDALLLEWEKSKKNFKNLKKMLKT